jgi:hypothetical protein
MARRPQRAATEQWEQLELLFTSPQQRQYELIRPVVLFGEPAAERAPATNTPQRRLPDTPKRFWRMARPASLPHPRPTDTPPPTCAT